MKKINSIGYGGKIIFVGIVFAFIIPILLSFISRNESILLEISKISFGIGVLILVLFFVWLKIELYQDKKLNIYYEKNKNEKLIIGEYAYECQVCGNRRVRQSDKTCNICGNKFI
jgi:hypothetical protein